MEHEDVGKRLTQLVAKLDAEDQMLVARHGIEGCPLNEVANELGVSLEAASKRWHRLRARLSDELPDLSSS